MFSGRLVLLFIIFFNFTLKNIPQEEGVIHNQLRIKKRKKKEENEKYKVYMYNNWREKKKAIKLYLSN